MVVKFQQYVKLLFLGLILLVTFSSCAQVFMIAAAVEENKAKNKYRDAKVEVHWQNSNAPSEKDEITKLKIKSITEMKGNYKKGKLRGKERKMFDESFDTNGNRLSCFAYENFLNKKMYFTFVANYNQDNKIIERTLSLKSNGIPQEKVQYIYDSENNLKKEQKTDIAGKSTGNTTYSYNDKGLLTKKVTLDHKSVIIKQENYTYNEKGQLTELKFNNLNMVRKYISKYNEEGKLIEKITMAPNGVILAKSTLDSEGNIVKKIEKDSEGIVTSTTKNTFENGRLVRKLYISNSAYSPFDAKYSFNYDEAGKLILVEYDMIMTKKMKKTQHKIKYNYNDNDLKEAEEHYKNNELAEKTTYKYSYYE